MKNANIVFTKPITEAMRLLTRVAEQKTYEERLMQYENRIGHSLSETVVAKLGFLDQVERELVELLGGDLSEVLFYFQSKKNEDACPAELLYLWGGNENVSERTPEEWQQKVESLSEKEYYDEVGRIIFTYSQKVKDSLGMESCRNLEDVMRLVLSLELDSDTKLKLQDILLNRSRHFERTNVLLHKALDCVIKHEEEINLLCESFTTYWETEMAGKTFQKYIGEDINWAGTMDDNPLGWILEPCIFIPTQFSYTINMDDKTGEYVGQDTATVGILYEDTYRLSDYLKSKGGLDEEQAMKLLKLLGDKSKFEILSFTKDQPAYGAALAEHLGLTTATVSHHTSELYSAGLLKFEKQGNKLYYSEKRETIERLIAYLNDKL